MAEILVTASEVKAKADDLKGLNDRFKTQVEDLKSKEASLKTMWEGEANTAFHNAFTRDVEQFNNFYNLIIQYYNALLQIAAEYEKAEAKNVITGNQRTY